MRIAGSWTIARPYGVPIRIHWSVPVCALLAGGIRFAPGAWLAFLLLVLVHEAGHAFVVRRVGARPTALDILGFGGLCWWEGAVSPIGRACIAWAGVWAQMIVFAITGVAVLVLGRPAHWFADQMVDVALFANLWLMGINLLPLPGLDGKEAWSLFPLLRRRFAARRGAQAAQALRVLVPRLGTWREGKPPPSSLPDAGRRRTTIADLAEGGADDIDESDYTPEVREVLERTRTIARDAARDPTQVGRVPGRGRRGGGAG